MQSPPRRYPPAAASPRAHRSSSHPDAPRSIVVHPLKDPTAPRRRQRIGWRLLVCAARGLAWAGHRLARDVRFCVSAIVVENVTAEAHGLDPQAFRPHCSAAELRHLANVRRDRPIWNVDLNGTVQGVMRHPWVASVEASRRWPDTVVIRVIEHRPVLLLQQGALFYVNERAEVFKRARGSDLDYPVLTGLDPDLVERNPDVARRILVDAIALLERVEESGELLGDDLSEIRFHDQDGFSLVLRGGTELALGFADAGERLARLERLRSNGLDPSQPHRIDLAPETVALVSPPSSRTSPGLD